jgi:hypothetical protein
VIAVTDSRVVCVFVVVYQAEEDGMLVTIHDQDGQVLHTSERIPPRPLSRFRQDVMSKPLEGIELHHKPFFSHIEIGTL